MKTEKAPSAVKSAANVSATEVVAALKQAKPEAVKPEAKLVKFRALSFDPASLEKLALDGQSATGLVKAAYTKAGFPFGETLLESQSDGVTTLNKAITTAKKLVKDHGLSAKVANTWLAYKQVELALRFARNIGSI